MNENNNLSYQKLDELFLPLDRQEIRRTKNIRLIPTINNRKGGKYSYAEWAHVIGIFQTVMHTHLKDKENNQIFDIGCGTGLMGIASEPFVGKYGKYIGLDVMQEDIDFCRTHYPSNFEFIHFDVTNAEYAPSQRGSKLQYPIEDESVDLVTALSVWTHLNEEDAMFYFKEINRVLRVGGKAIVTFFLLDRLYEKSINSRSAQQGQYHMTPQDAWVFDQPVYGSDSWFHTKWAKPPEGAIGVTSHGLDKLILNSGLRIVEHYSGNWKEVPGVYFQDILVFEKI